MTPTTPEQARKLAALLEKMGDLHAQIALISMADQVDALTKERDDYKLLGDVVAGGIEAVQAANQRLARERDAIPGIKAERDALSEKVDRLEWANKGIAEWRGEYALMKANRDKAIEGIVALTKERDALTSDNASLHRQLSQWHLIAIERAKERDDAWLQNTALDARCAKLEAERDALASAAKLALDALDHHPSKQGWMRVELADGEVCEYKIKGV